MNDTLIPKSPASASISAAPRARVSIVIVNWNTGACLRQCVSSVSQLQQNEFVFEKVVVVDNNSEDGSADDLSGEELPLEIIRNPTNRGFSAACNQGGGICGGNYVLFLNPDTVLSPDCLDSVVRFMESPEGARIGICGVRLLDESGHPTTVCGQFPSLGRHVAEALGLPKLAPKLFPALIRSAAELSTSCTVDQVIGAFFFVRRNLYEQLQGFDERFFVYFEEVDFSLRAAQRGVFSYYLATIAIGHIGRVSSRTAYGKALGYLLHSRLKYAFKHYGGLGALLLTAVMLTIEPIMRAGHAAFSRNGATLREVGIAYTYFVRALAKGKIQ